MSYIGTTGIGKMFLGTTEIAKAYLGSDLVFQNSSPFPYDARVEYIQTNGNQYINFGFKGNAATFALYVDFQPTSALNQTRLIAANVANAPCQIYVNGSNKYGYRMASSWGNAGPSTTVGTDRHTWLCDYYNKVNTIDGTNYTMGSASTGTTSSNLLLCGPYTSNNKFQGKIYAAKIYESGVLKVDFIPVRVGTTAYMYDTVSNTLFGNAGTGNYTYGNDVNQ